MGGSMTVVQWESVREEVAHHLQQLIQLESVNPPGNETLVADYLARVAAAEELPVHVLERAPGRGNFVTRIQGRGTQRPLLLMGHGDVVPADPARWSHPPFAGEIYDGRVWGRGAIDMKHQVAAELVVMLLIKRLGLVLDRDLIMVTFADEEAGGQYGARWMWQEHRELIDAEFAINEGGGQAVDLDGKRFYLCQTGEKGSQRFRIVARGPGGHGAVPLPDTAMHRMVAALDTLLRYEPPTVLSASVGHMLGVFAATLGGDTARLVSEIEARPTADLLDQLPLSEGDRRRLAATTRNTVVPTVIAGGERISVIPGEVSCRVDARLLPGQDPAAFLAEMRALLEPGVEVESIEDGWSGFEAAPDSPLFDVFVQTIERLDPGAAVVPFLAAGSTDAVSLPGIKVYGFMPMALSDDESGGMHGDDEQIAIDNLLFGTRALFEIVTRYCQAG
jgi:acetylornithine deacetylase/succinyl-diaminopimelate desuccinylase-like protein